MNFRPHGYGVTPPLNVLDDNDLRTRAWKTALRSEFVEYKSPFVLEPELDLIERKLYKDIQTLSNMCVTGIDKRTVLNWQDYPFSTDWFQHLPPDTIHDLAVLHQRYLDEYLKLVRVNFPTFWQNLPLASSMPLKCFIWITNVLENPMLCLVKCRGQIDNGNQVIPCEPRQISVNKKTLEITHEGQRYRGFEMTETVLFPLIFPASLVYPKHYMPFTIDGGLAPLRRLVYEEIRSDLKQVFPNFAISLGAAPYFMPGLFTH